MQTKGSEGPNHFQDYTTNEDSLEVNERTGVAEEDDRERGQIDYPTLSPEEGAELFRQSAPQRVREITLEAAADLSRKVGGHPLSLRLLAGTFNQLTLSLADFVRDCELHLLLAEDKYVGLGHRQRSLYASIETSVRYLDAPLAELFSKLWIFYAPFLPDRAAAIFDPDFQATEERPHSPVYDQLHALWLHGLLTLTRKTFREGTVEFYSLPQTVRIYIEQCLAGTEERDHLLAQFGTAYADWTRSLRGELNHGGIAAFFAEQSHEDLERGALYATGITRGYYLLEWGWVLKRLGYVRRALELIEQALEIGRLEDRKLEALALNWMAMVYRDMGELERTLELLEQALLLLREMEDRVGEGVILNTIADLYLATGQSERALELYEQASSLNQEGGDKVGEADTLQSLSRLYQDMRQPKRALELLEQALLLIRGVGNKAGEASMLNSIAAVYYDMEQPERALELLEQALEITRELGNQASEAVTLQSIARLNFAVERPERALELFEQALQLIREIGDQNGEAVTLHDIAGAYLAIGQPEQALGVYEQVLSLQRETRDWTSNVTTLSKMAEIYHGMKQLQRALELLEQVLSLRRAVGDREGEASTLNRMAGVYYDTGRPERALELFEQALQLIREIGDQNGEAVALHNIAGVYLAIGQPEQALGLFEQALLLDRDVGDRAGEASTLNRIGDVYNRMRQPRRALELYEQALPLQRAVGDRDGEITTLDDMANVYQMTGRAEQALKYYERALLLDREVGDRTSEAARLNNKATVYLKIKQPLQALELLERALLIEREMGHRRDEAGILGNMAEVHRAIRQPMRALELLEQALPIMRAEGNRAGEANVLNNMAFVYQTTGQPERALELFEQALPIMRAEGNRAGEANVLNNISGLLYEDLNRQPEAIAALQQAIAVLDGAGLSRDESGCSRKQLEADLHVMRQGGSLGQAKQPKALLVSQLQIIVQNTVAVLTTMQERYTEWYETIKEILLKTQQEGDDRQIDVDFFAAVLELLEGRVSSLPDDHPYAPALIQIKAGIAGSKGKDSEDSHFPVDPELVPLSISALLGRAEEKMYLLQYLVSLDEQVADEQLKTLLQTIQLALFGEDLLQLGQNLKGDFLETWRRIVIGVETGGLDSGFFEMIKSNTLAVLGSESEAMFEWRAVLLNTKSQAQQDGFEQLSALIDAVLGLLDAGGNPEGLGGNLTGYYEQTWQALINSLSE